MGFLKGVLWKRKVKTMIEVTENSGVIDFTLPNGSVKTVRDNTYLHCNFTKLEIVGYFTSIGYFERKV